MKKWLAICLCVGLLTGCSAETFETLGPVSHVSATAAPARSMVLALPADAAVLTSSGDDMLYICKDYTIAVQTVSGGDLTDTIRSLTGYTPSQLTVMESTCGDHRRYDFVWTAAGEGGDQICRAAVLDDGNYHYCLTLMADATAAGELTDRWNDLLGSFCLSL